MDAEAEEQTFAKIKAILDKSIDELPQELQDLKRSLKVEIEEEGLSIQVIDHDTESSFEEGTDTLTPHARNALKLMSQFITRLPNMITVTGHTGEEGDALTNWELSLHRANAARRALAAYGVVMLGWLQPYFGDLQLPASIYNGIILVMTVLAVIGRVPPLATAGALLFLVLHLLVSSFSSGSLKGEGEGGEGEEDALIEPYP